MYRDDGEDRGGFRPRRDSGFGGRSNFVPVNVGDEIDVKIEAVGEKGDGVAKVKGFVLSAINRSCLIDARTIRSARRALGKGT